MVKKKKTEEFYIGQIFEDKYPSMAAVWCNANNAQIQEIDPVTKEVEETYVEMVETEQEMVIPAEYDENGEMISEQRTEIQVVEEPQEKTRTVVVTVRRFQIQEIPEQPAPTQEEQSKKREQAYIVETDPIQTHIDRLKDGEQTPEIIAEIEQLRIERDEKIAAIKERYPYPTDPIIND